MKQYTVGAMLFCDFHFSGKPHAKCIEVIEPGTGRSSSTGRIRAKVTADHKGYRKGEILELNCFEAVPLKQILPLKQGQFFTRVSTHYEWVKPADSDTRSGQEVPRPPHIGNYRDSGGTAARDQRRY